MDNLEEVDELLEKYNVLKLHKKRNKNLSRLITSTEMKLPLIFQQTKSPGPHGFTSEFFQKLRKLDFFQQFCSF